MRAVYVLIIFCLIGCESSRMPGNPPAPGFDLQGSDQKAIEIADLVMEAMGGRQAWDNVETITWTFFGRRTHVWNKQDNSNLMMVPADSLVVNHRLDETSGSVVLRGIEQTHPDTITKYLDYAKSAWINDSYWLVMPFKLKDSGVTLTYEDEIFFEEDRPADRLRLTFDQVGDTPENAYLVTIPRDSRLVEQWDFYREANDSIPAFATPWADYQQYGDILLSGNRGKYSLTDIEVTMTPVPR